jgi:hypothetical protein
VRIARGTRNSFLIAKNFPPYFHFIDEDGEGIERKKCQMMMNRPSEGGGKRAGSKGKLRLGVATFVSKPNSGAEN